MYYGYLFVSGFFDWLFKIIFVVLYLLFFVFEIVFVLIIVFNIMLWWLVVLLICWYGLYVFGVWSNLVIVVVFGMFKFVVDLLKYFKEVFFIFYFLLLK